MRRRELGLRPEDSIAVIHDEATHATRIAPLKPEAYVTLGRADLLIGCVPCARRSAERAHELGGNPAELAVLRSRIAELSGKPDEARAALEQASAMPGLPAQALYWLRLALGELAVRQEDFRAADRWFAHAAEAEPGDPEAVVRRAHVRLFHRGDLEGAVEVGTTNPRAAASIEIKRMLAIARYVSWSRERNAGRPAGDLQRLAQTSYVGPAAALIACARYPALSSEFKVMLEAGVAPGVDSRDDAGDTALLAAVAGGNDNVARLLLARAADVNVQDRYRRRPLQFAVERSAQVLAKMLLEAGAEVDYVDADHRSPLLMAVQKRDAALTSILLRHRSPAQALPRRAGDLLAAAARADDVATLNVLLDAGIPADMADAGRPTALVVAVLWRSANAARLLLQYGADAAAAVEAAREVEDGDLIELLKRSHKRSI
jgi:tetratricopeptide (TPR) repeat protein